MHQRIGAGIARSFQLVNLFDQLSALDNVALRSSRARARRGSCSRWPTRDPRCGDEAMEMLHVSSAWSARRAILAGGLSQGERKLLDVAVAYALRPKLLFLDEPTSGVSTREKAPIMDIDHRGGALGAASPR